jgi:dethiobiotin synthetase
VRSQGGRGLLRGVFVTGTDTGVGKTVAAATLLCRFRVPHEEGHSTAIPKRLRYWKPIQTGVPPDDDTATVRRLTGCREEELLDKGIRLPQPVSPHLAARLSGTVIDVREIEALARAQPASDRWIVEGAGGVLVPINDQMLMVDLIVRLSLPALVVARTTLGTINHTLLTLEALRRRDVTIAGVLLAGDRNVETREAIRSYGHVPIVGELPRLTSLTRESVSREAEPLMDPDGRFEELFR